MLDHCQKMRDEWTVVNVALEQIYARVWLQEVISADHRRIAELCAVPRAASRRNASSLPPTIGARMIWCGGNFLRGGGSEMAVGDGSKASSSSRERLDGIDLPRRRSAEETLGCQSFARQATIY